MSSRISRLRCRRNRYRCLCRQLGLAGLPFDVVEQPDIGQYDGRAHHVRRLRLEEPAPGVRPAGHLHDLTLRILVQVIVTGVGVRLQISAEVVEESFRSGPAAIRRVVVDRVGVPLVAHIGPDPAHPGARSASVQHVDRRVVGPDHLRVQDLVAHPCIQRMDELGTLAHPAAQSLARQLHALTPVDAFLPVQRQMVGVLRDRHLSQQARPRPSLVDRRSGLVGRHHRATLSDRRTFDRPPRSHERRPGHTPTDRSSPRRWAATRRGIRGSAVRPPRGHRPLGGARARPAAACGHGLVSSAEMRESLLSAEVSPPSRFRRSRPQTRTAGSRRPAPAVRRSAGAAAARADVGPGAVDADWSPDLRPVPR